MNNRKTFISKKIAFSQKKLFSFLLGIIYLFLVSTTFYARSVHEISVYQPTTMYADVQPHIGLASKTIYVDVTGIDGDWDFEVGQAEQTIQIADYNYNLQICELSMIYSQNNCVDNDDGTFTTTYDLELSWSDAPSTGGLMLSLIGDGTINTTSVSAATIAAGNFDYFNKY